MREDWREIRECPQFVVSNYGEIVNQKTGRSRTPMRNAQGVAMITLAHSGRVFTRGLALLVAGAFIEPEHDLFRTPINLDGDRMNCRADNLMWRPRWFSVKYHRQFFQPQFYEIKSRLQIVETGEVYIGVKDPAIQYGLHFADIFLSASNHTRVFPTKHEFRFV